MVGSRQAVEIGPGVIVVGICGVDDGVAVFGQACLTVLLIYCQHLVHGWFRISI